MASDTLKDSIVELTGLKDKDLKPAPSDNMVRSWQAHLQEHGFAVKGHFGHEVPSDRHIVLYNDAAGDLQAVLSDADSAKHVKAISRLTVSKVDAKQAKPPKAGDGKDA
jgi:hypothetical protein